MQARWGRVLVSATVLAGSGACLGAGSGVGGGAQSGGNGSVLIRDGNANAASEDGVRISAAVMAGLNLTKPDPDMLVARRMHLSGPVVVSVRIDPEGKVTRATAISGLEPLRDPAVEAVKRWTYKPYLLHGKAVAVATNVTVMFYPS